MSNDIERVLMNERVAGFVAARYEFIRKLPEDIGPVVVAMLEAVGTQAYASGFQRAVTVHQQIRDAVQKHARLSDDPE